MEFKSLAKSNSEIQNQFLMILHHQIKAYLGNTSSSISMDESEELLQSILFTFRFADCSQIDLENFQQSQQELIRQQHDLQSRQPELNAMMLSIPIEAYHQTVASIFAELPNYPAEFFAHKTIGNIDYPLAIPIDDQKTLGLSYLIEYISRINLENQFCQLFPLEKLHLLLEAYQLKSKVPYQQDLFNLFELTFDQTFSIFLANRPIDLAFDLTPAEQAKIQHELHVITETTADLDAHLHNQYQKFCHYLQLKEQKYYADYLKRYQQKLTLAHQLQQDNFSFLFSVSLPTATSWFISEGDTVSAEVWNEILTKIPFLSSKAIFQLLEETEISIFDYQELFENQIILPEEMVDFFHWFSLEKQTAFIYLIMKRQRDHNFDDFLALSSFQNEWEEHFHTFILQRTDSEQNHLRQTYHHFLF